MLAYHSQYRWTPLSDVCTFSRNNEIRQQYIYHGWYWGQYYSFRFASGTGRFDHRIDIQHGKTIHYLTLLIPTLINMSDVSISTAKKGNHIYCALVYDYVEKVGANVVHEFDDSRPLTKIDIIKFNVKTDQWTQKGYVIDQLPAINSNLCIKDDIIHILFNTEENMYHYQINKDGLQLAFNSSSEYDDMIDSWSHGENIYMLYEKKVITYNVNINMISEISHNLDVKLDIPWTITPKNLYIQQDTLIIFDYITGTITEQPSISKIKNSIITITYYEDDDDLRMIVMHGMEDGRMHQKVIKDTVEYHLPPDEDDEEEEYVIIHTNDGECHCFVYKLRQYSKYFKTLLEGNFKNEQIRLPVDNIILAQWCRLMYENYPSSDFDIIHLAELYKLCDYLQSDDIKKKLEALFTVQTIEYLFDDLIEYPFFQNMIFNRIKDAKKRILAGKVDMHEYNNIIKRMPEHLCKKLIDLMI